ncbi:MAG TPA: hypothetical protein V6C63_21605 [Allocoleopsis sp.]
MSADAFELIGDVTLSTEIDNRFVKAMTLIMFADFCNRTSTDPEEFFAKITADLRADYAQQIELVRGTGIDADSLSKKIEDQVGRQSQQYQSLIESVMKHLNKGDRS